MPPKRLIVACDGTWQNSDNGFVRDSWLPWKTSGHLATPTNVTRICRALEPRSSEGVQQIAYYQAGVGSEDNWYSFFLGGYLGEGISEHIREAYGFLCNNYEDGDEIVLIGFSRGAFTARSIGALIDEVGLLTKKGMGSFYPVFEDWEQQVNRKYKPQYGTTDWPTSRPGFNSPEYVKEMVARGLTRPNIPVKAVAVWDTVGTLGVPDIKILGFPLHTEAHRKYSFVDTEVPSNVEHAYQALALDEERESYPPTLWESPKPEAEARLKLLKQCWFPGVHSSIGGGYADTSIADITLAWLVTQLSRHLSFIPEYIKRQQQLNVQFYTEHKESVSSWAMGQIQRSDGGILNTILGRQVRTPGNYYVIDPTTGRPTSTRLTNTCETVHPSVRYRILQNGPGLVANAKSKPTSSYAPKALAGWHFVDPNEEDQSVSVGKDVEGRGRWISKPKDGRTTVIMEDRIETGTAEMDLLKRWGGEVEQTVMAE